MKNNETKSIMSINISGFTAANAVDQLKSRLATLNRSTFNIITLAAYATGRKVPAYTDTKNAYHPESQVARAFTQVELAKMLDVRPSTVSTWLKAYDAIISHGHFDLFSQGVVQFKHTKIMFIYDNWDIFESQDFVELMGYSHSTLDTLKSDIESEALKTKMAEGLINDNADETTGESTDESTDNDRPDNDDTDDFADYTTFTYNHVDYRCKKTDIEKFIEDFAKAL